MSLKALQQSFIQQLAHSQSADKFLEYLEPCGNLLPEHQLAIYQNNVRGALQKSLAQVYPVCQKIVGDNYFKQLASVYIKQYPSKHHDLNSYGEYFSDFIKSQCLQRNELNDFSYLSDLVQLEWFYQQVYYAAEGSLFDFSAYAKLNEQQQVNTVFQLIPCLNFFSSDYPVLSIWQMNQEGSNKHQSLDLNSENCCVFRKKNLIELRIIDTTIYNLLTYLIAGKTLEELALMGVDNYLPALIEQGWIGGFKVKHV
ncbi:MAG: putative DNA-binding domain-containing protein [Methylococcales bacterium]|nr:putative DNA-binding domain-containing protein [Methylococcales bacterium]